MHIRMKRAVGWGSSSDKNHSNVRIESETTFQVVPCAVRIKFWKNPFALLSSYCTVPVVFTRMLFWSTIAGMGCVSMPSMTYLVDGTFSRNDVTSVKPLAWFPFHNKVLESM
eukprot:GHVO01025976.1.p1 GENE.GHVO01025976.1~~GHVO01025976.1.p1  ORF type:complete len:112 (-),score=2.91 GHVO01025976.1:10-345(-)